MGKILLSHPPPPLHKPQHLTKKCAVCLPGALLAWRKVEDFPSKVEVEQSRQSRATGPYFTSRFTYICAAKITTRWLSPRSAKCFLSQAHSANGATQRILSSRTCSGREVGIPQRAGNFPFGAVCKGHMEDRLVGGMMVFYLILAHWLFGEPPGYLLCFFDCFASLFLLSLQLHPLFLLLGIVSYSVPF